MSEVHEFVLLSFKDEISHDEQVATMRALDPYVAGLAGFVSREYFHSAETGRWVDHVVWASLEDAKASEAIMEDPGAAALFARLDSGSINFARYDRV